MKYISATGISVMILMILAAVVILGTVSCGAIINSDESTALLKNQGYDRIHLVNKTVFTFKCGSEDTVLFTYRATNVRNQPVKVEVCDGLLKGATIRG